MTDKNLHEVMAYLNNSNLIFDKSIYKYGIYKIVLKQLYPELTDYKIKKIFDELLNFKFISKVECHKSFKYQFNGYNKYNCKKKKEEEEVKTTDYNLDENGSVVLYFN